MLMTYTRCADYASIYQTLTCMTLPTYATSLCPSVAGSSIVDAQSFTVCKALTPSVTVGATGENRGFRQAQARVSPPGRPSSIEPFAVVTAFDCRPVISCSFMITPESGASPAATGLIEEHVDAAGS